MKKNVTVIVMMLALVSLLAACGSLNKATPAALDDEAIEAEVRGRFAESADLKAFQISVDVQDGVVTLNGDVDSMTQRDAAVRAAREVSGVRSVVNNLRVRR
jgi:osmotically-inducible protein OsmY